MLFINPSSIQRLFHFPKDIEPASFLYQPTLILFRDSTMAAPNTPFSYSDSLFGNFQIGASRTPHPPSPSSNFKSLGPPPPYSPYVTSPPPDQQQQVHRQLSLASLSPPLSEIASSSGSQLPQNQKQSCPSCRGNRYDYTSYFHNSRIFSSPPHQLLPFIEESYVLKNLLQSLLFNYVVRSERDESSEMVKLSLEAWNAKVEGLLIRVRAELVGRATNGMAEVEEAMSKLRAGVQNIVTLIWLHISGERRMDMSPARMKEVVCEFRKLWEAVWVRCL